MRSVFFGTPAIAVPALEALATVSEVQGVVCQPDRPAGRSMTLREPAVKVRARELGLPVHQPRKVKTGNLHEWLRERDVDVALVMAYGRILPPAVLTAPRRGCMNLHASLLPRYRGAAPINWCLVEGEQETGVCLMQMDEGLDTGPVFACRQIHIPTEMNAGELAEALGKLAAQLVREELHRAVSGELQASPQEHDRATLAPPIEREHTRIDWRATPRRLANLVRGMAPRPGAHALKGRKSLRIQEARASDLRVPGPPGRVHLTQVPGSRERQLLVACGPEPQDASYGALQLLTAQLEGRKPLAARDLINGRVLEEGDQLA